MKPRRRAPAFLGVLLAGLACACAAVGPARASEAPAWPSSTAPVVLPAVGAPRCLRADRDLSEADASAFLDGFIPAQMARMKATAAAVAIVRDGKVVVTRGFGSATLDGRTPVDPETSAFRLASTSKALTLVAAMQMVEQGRLKLDDDVERYLDFKLKLPFGPVTVRNLMTHTSGFQSMDRDQFARTPDGIFPLRQYLIETQPIQVRRPGTRVFYTNYDAVMLGYIVQRLSGETFQRYMAEHVFAPLGMTHTLFRRTDEHPPGLVEAHDPSDAYLQSMPGGGAMSTAADMAQYMLMLLGGGANAHGRVLKPETVSLMASPARLIDPRVSPMDLLLYRTDRHGYRILRHDGRLVSFVSLMAVMPDCGVGIWAGYADSEVPTETDETLEALLKRYFVLPPPPVAMTPAPAQPDVSGTYSLEYNPASVLRFQDLFSQNRVRRAADGALTVDGMANPDGRPRRFVPVSPTLFVEENGRSRLAFSRFAGGDMRMAIDLPIKEYRRMPWYDRLGPNLWAIAACALVCALTLAHVAWRASGRREGGATRIDAAAAFGAFSALLLSGYAWWLLSVEEKVDNTTRAVDGLVYLMFALGTLAAASPVVLVAALVAGRKAEPVGAWRAVQVAALLMVAVLVLHWNLASWDIRY